MIRKCLYYTSIATVVTIISSGFKPIDVNSQDWFFTQSDSVEHFSNPVNLSEYENNFSLLYTGKSFTGFKEKMAFRESRGMYHLVNNFGYMGKYQFGGAALRSIGIKNHQEFLRNPAMQEAAFLALLSKNKHELQNEIEKFSGTTVGGVKVTESGILAAAHLVGAGSVKKFFKSNGRAVIRDGFGTSLTNYLKSFEGYDVSVVEANSNPSIRM